MRSIGLRLDVRCLLSLQVAKPFWETMEALRKQAGNAGFALVLIHREAPTGGQDMLNPTGWLPLVSENLAAVMYLENPNEEAALVDLSALVNGG